MHDATTTAIGTKHGRLTIIEELCRYVNDSGRGRGLVKCQCDCGNKVIINRKRIYNAEYRGITLSCGCLKIEKDEQTRIRLEKAKTEKRIVSEMRKAERLSELERTKEARYIRKCLRARLAGMKRRCYNPNCSRWSRYGGRGIKICEEWRNNLNAFVEWAISNGFDPKLEIDRIDPNGDYCPSNCQWITRSENVRRQDRTTRKGATVIEWNGERMTAREWERKRGLKRGTIGWRLRHGFNAHDAIFGKIV